MWLPSRGGEDPLEKEMAPVFLPGKSHGQRVLAGYSPWGHKELDTTEGLKGCTLAGWKGDRIPSAASFDHIAFLRSQRKDFCA